MVIRYTPHELYEIGRSIFIETKIEDWIFHYADCQDMCPSITSTSQDDDNGTQLHPKLPSATTNNQSMPSHRQSYAQFCIDVLAPFVDESLFDRGLQQHRQQQLNQSQQPPQQAYQKHPNTGKSIQLQISDLIPSVKPNISSDSSTISTPSVFGPSTNCNNHFHEPTVEELEQQNQLTNPVAEFFRKAQLNFHAQTSIDPTKVRRLSEVEAEIIGSQREMSY